MLNPSVLHNCRVALAANDIDPKKLALVQQTRRKEGRRRGSSTGRGGGRGRAPYGCDVTGFNSLGAEYRGSLASGLVLDPEPPSTSLPLESTDDLLDAEAALVGGTLMSNADVQLVNAVPNPHLGGVKFLHGQYGRVSAVVPPPPAPPTHPHGNSTLMIAKPKQKKEYSTYRESFTKQRAQSARQQRATRHHPLCAPTASGMSLGAPSSNTVGVTAVVGQLGPETITYMSSSELAYGPSGPRVKSAKGRGGSLGMGGTIGSVPRRYSTTTGMNSDEREGGRAAVSRSRCSEVPLAPEVMTSSGEYFSCFSPSPPRPPSSRGAGGGGMIYPIGRKPTQRPAVVEGIDEVPAAGARQRMHTVLSHQISAAGHTATASSATPSPANLLHQYQEYMNTCSSNHSSNGTGTPLHYQRQQPVVANGTSTAQDAQGTAQDAQGTARSFNSRNPFPTGISNPSIHAQWVRRRKGQH